MTCHFDPSTGDVFDHEGAKVGTLNGSDWEQRWTGNYPQEALDVLREAMDETKPSAYNQVLLADMASENIKPGVPE